MSDSSKHQSTAQKEGEFDPSTEIAELYQKGAELQQKIAKLGEIYKDTLNNLNQKIIDLTSQFEEEHRTSKEKIDELTAKVAYHENKPVVADNSKELTELKQKIADMEKQIEEERQKSAKRIDELTCLADEYKMKLQQSKQQSAIDLSNKKNTNDEVENNAGMGALDPKLYSEHLGMDVMMSKEEEEARRRAEELILREMNAMKGQLAMKNESKLIGNQGADVDVAASLKRKRSEEELNEEEKKKEGELNEEGKMKEEEEEGKNKIPKFSAMSDHLEELDRNKKEMEKRNMNKKVEEKETEKEKPKDTDNVKDRKQLIVRNVPHEASPSDVESIFSVFDGFKSFHMPHVYGSHNGYAFVNFVNKDYARRAFFSFGVDKTTLFRNKKIMIEYGRSESKSVESARRALAASMNN